LTTNTGRPARKDAQAKISQATSDVKGKAAKAAVAEAQALLQGRSGLSTDEKVSNLKGARAALKVAATHPKNADREVVEVLEAARKSLKQAVKAYS
jgi:hypothetical protein